VTGEIRRREIIACCQNRLTARHCESVHSAIAEVELCPVTHAFSKASECRDCQPCLDFIEGNDYDFQFIYELIQQGKRRLTQTPVKYYACLEERY